MLLQKIRLHLDLFYHRAYIKWNVSSRFKYGIYLLVSCGLFLCVGGGLYHLNNAWNYDNHMITLRANPQYEQLLAEKRFVRRIAPTVQRVSKTRYHHVLPSITLAQAGIESNWGSSKLYTQDHNPFGIKGDYKNQSAQYTTTEVKNGQNISVKARFRKYPNLSTAVADHNYLLYKGFLGNENSNNYKTDAHVLVHHRYATDPAYATKLIQVIQKLHLTRYDE